MSFQLTQSQMEEFASFKNQLDAAFQKLQAAELAANEQISQILVDFNKEVREFAKLSHTINSFMEKVSEDIDEYMNMQPDGWCNTPEGQAVAELHDAWVDVWLPSSDILETDDKIEVVDSDLKTAIAGIKRLPESA